MYNMDDKKLIIEMVNKIENVWILNQILQFIQNMVKDETASQEEKPPVQTAEHKRMLGKIQKVRNMDIYKYTLYTDDMNIIKDLSAGDLFTVIGYSVDYGFYQGMQYMKDKQKRKAGKKLIPGSRASKIHELMELAGKIPDKRLDALLCWANQYQEEGSVSNAI